MAFSPATPPAPCRRRRRCASQLVHLLGIPLILPLVLPALVGCVSASDYQELRTSYDHLRAKAQDWEDQRVRLNAEVRRLRQDLEDVQSRNQALTEDMPRVHEETTVRQPTPAAEPPMREVVAATLERLAAEFQREVALREPAADASPETAPDAVAIAASLEGSGVATEVEAQGDRLMIRFSGDVTFALGSADLTPEAQGTLARLAAELRDATTFIRVEGHTDNQPMRNPENLARFGDNQGLSLARAQAVFDDLVARGIAPGRITVVGRGAAYPAASNSTPEGRAKNRRVDIFLGSLEAIPDGQ